MSRSLTLVNCIRQWFNPDEAVSKLRIAAAPYYDRGEISIETGCNIVIPHRYAKVLKNYTHEEVMSAALKEIYASKKRVASNERIVPIEYQPPHFGGVGVLTLEMHMRAG